MIMILSQVFEACQILTIKAEFLLHLNMLEMKIKSIPVLLLKYILLNGLGGSSNRY